MDGSIETYLLVGFAVSVIATVGDVVVVEIVLVKLSPCYFGNPLSVGLPNTHPLVRWTTVLLKNLLGAALVLGLIMSVPGMPGPGIITVVLGLMLLDFAERRRWAGWIIGRPPILRTINALRRRYSKPPFVIPPAANP